MQLLYNIYLLPPYISDRRVRHVMTSGSKAAPSLFRLWPRRHFQALVKRPSMCLSRLERSEPGAVSARGVLERRLVLHGFPTVKLL
jgi:hypothetical protein